METEKVLTHDQILSRLELPSRQVYAVLDTDTYNEIDDQFALTYALLNAEQIALEAVYAAPFLNARSSSPQDGMLRSYAEARRVLDLLGRSDAPGLYLGAERFIGAQRDAVISPAVEDLIERSRHGGRGPLYVVAIGAPTNIASALLAEPEIASRIVVVWLGGHPIIDADADEFNLRQDLAASRILFNSGVPLISVPCRQVAELLSTTLPELAAHVRQSGKIGEYLYKICADYISGSPGKSRPIWDLAAVALLVNPAWFKSVVISSPQITDDLRWQPTTGRHPVRVVTYLNRDQIFGSLFAKLRAEAENRVRHDFS